MKRCIILFAVCLMAVSCKTVTVNQKIDEIKNFHLEETEINNLIEALDNDYPQREFCSNNAENAIDFLTLYASKRLKVNAKNLYIQDIAEDGMEGRNLIIEVPAKRNAKEPHTFILSANLEETYAVAAVLSALKAYGKLKIERKNNMKVVIYQSLNTFADAQNELGELIMYDLDITSDDNAAVKNVSFGESNYMYSRIKESVPQYLSLIGDYTIEQGSEYELHWPVDCPLYTLNVDKKDFATDAAAITTLMYIFN